MYFSFSQVIVAGRQWRLMWEDGQAGVYKLENASTASRRQLNLFRPCCSVQVTNLISDSTSEPFFLFSPTNDKRNYRASID